MEQKKEYILTNKDRLLNGAKVIAVLIWAVATVWTFSSVMTFCGTTEKVVAGIMLAFNAYAIFRKMKRIWDEM